MNPVLPPLLIGALVLAACQKEAQPDDIEAALQACGIDNARIAKRVPDGTQSDYEVDLGTTATGGEDSACMNGRLRAAGLRSVLTFYEAVPTPLQGR